MRCTICENPQVSQVNVLLASGTSIRAVARLHGLARTTLARHAKHVEPLERRLGLIEGDPDARGDPLGEALGLAARARTARERLRALEQVRAATKLKLRGAAEPDADERDLLDRNVAAAESAFRDAPDFETAARALSGWREALLHRLDAVPKVETIEVPLTVALADGTRLPGGGVVRQSPEDLFRGVPKRFRDATRYAVQRRIYLSFERERAGEEIKVFEVATGALAWRSDTKAR